MYHDNDIKIKLISVHLETTNRSYATSSCLKTKIGIFWQNWGIFSEELMLPFDNFFDKIISPQCVSVKTLIPGPSLEWIQWVRLNPLFFEKNYFTLSSFSTRLKEKSALGKKLQTFLWIYSLQGLKTINWDPLWGPWIHTFK